MKCVICQHGETAPGTTTVALAQDGAAVVIRGVPARICQTCGEEYVDEDVADRLLKIVRLDYGLSCHRWIIHHPPELRAVLHQYALTLANYAERQAKPEG